MGLVQATAEVNTRNERGGVAYQASRTANVPFFVELYEWKKNHMIPASKPIILVPRFSIDRMARWNGGGDVGLSSTSWEMSE